MFNSIDHIAIKVPDIEKASKWYVENVGGTIVYKTDSYYRIQLENICIAIIDENKYPDNHIGVLVENIEDLPDRGYRKEHRDGTIGVYVNDLYGNMVEYIWYSKEAKRAVDGET